MASSKSTGLRRWETAQSQIWSCRGVRKTFLQLPVAQGENWKSSILPSYPWSPGLPLLSQSGLFMVVAVFSQGLPVHPPLTPQPLSCREEMCKESSKQRKPTTWGQRVGRGTKGPAKQREDVGWRLLVLIGFRPLGLQKDLQPVSSNAPRLTCPRILTTPRKPHLPPIFDGSRIPEWTCPGEASTQTGKNLADLRCPGFCWCEGWGRGMRDGGWRGLEVPFYLSPIKLSILTSDWLNDPYVTVQLKVHRTSCPQSE